MKLLRKTLLNFSYPENMLNLFFCVWLSAGVWVILERIVPEVGENIKLEQARKDLGYYQDKYQVQHNRAYILQERVDELLKGNQCVTSSASLQQPLK